MKENTEVMKQNVEMLKIKIGAKTDWFNLLTLKTLLFFQIWLILNMGKQSNLYNQNRHQYDFLNPDGKKNLHLDHHKKIWVEDVPIDYTVDNKE